ncbi:hypothetical protein Tco_1100653 [Tanacetum coccineum]
MFSSLAGKPWFRGDRGGGGRLSQRTPLPLLEKLPSAEPQTGPNTIKFILNSCSTKKVETSKGVIINETNTSSTPAKRNKNVVSTSKEHSTLAGKLKDVKTEDVIPMSVCDIKKPIWYLDSGCSRHMTGVKSYLYKFVEQPGPKVVFGDDSTYITDGLVQ